VSGVRFMLPTSCRLVLAPLSQYYNSTKNIVLQPFISSNLSSQFDTPSITTIPQKQRSWEERWLQRSTILCVKPLICLFLLSLWWWRRKTCWRGPRKSTVRRKVELWWFFENEPIRMSPGGITSSQLPSYQPHQFTSVNKIKYKVPT